MAILTFALSAVMILASFGLLWGSLNLVPTEMGLLYGVCGVVLLGCGAIVLAIGALITRLGQVAEPARKPVAVEAPAPVEAPRVEPEVEALPEQGEILYAAPTEPSPPLAEREPLVEPRSGAPLRPAEGEAANRAKTEPYVIGRYAAGGANYAIYSDGTIEAETDEGAMRFATMSEFRAFISARKR